ncbi:SLC13 family permease [Desulfoplanes formicivorans]|uniref:Transporter n=1 Tax=Desulfoplanes formicivorans TaxID=1592317 RepID=A0A194AKF1_9BACT|nr:SLC13 family permease [Desulfoplanes formicivorans]GAU09715.1 transporter [Desulfoplanes formicivorans]
MPFPPPPNLHAMAVLALTAVALVLFSRKNISLESSSLFVLVALAVGFELFPFHAQGKTLHAVDFFTGFGNEALIAVCSLMIAGHGILRTGALEPIGRFLAKLWRKSPKGSLLLTLLLGAVISAFINNVPVVVLLLPVLVSVSLKTGTSPAPILMPMGFSTLLGGTTTTIGTSTNLLVVAVAAEMGLEKFNMFDFVVPASLAGSVGIAYLWLIAPRLLPQRKLAISDSSARIFTAHLAITQDSPVVGKPLSKALSLTDGKMHVIALERGEGNGIMLLPDVILQAGDHLVIDDTPENLKEFETILQGTLFPAGSEDTPIDDDNPLHDDDQQIAEIAIFPGSRLAATTLDSAGFVDRYGLMPLALHRSGKRFQRSRDKIETIRLQSGDILLVQGPRDRIAAIKTTKDVMVLDAIVDLPYSRKAPIAMGIMIGIVAISALDILPIAISAMCGTLLMIMTGCLGWRDATRALSAQVILIVVTSLALGTAMLTTGGAAYLGALFVSIFGNASPAVVTSALMMLMAIFTNIISNNATAVIGTPIAASIASQMGLPPEPFILAVLFGANMSFATPMAYKTNLLVMNAGEYTFGEFLKVGIPLVLIMWATLSLLLSVPLWGNP